MLRRHLLITTSAMLASGMTMLHGALAGRRLGLVIHSYSHRWHGKYSSIKHQAFHDVLDVMDHGRELGIGSLQIGVEGWSLDLAQKVRASSESYDMKLEGSIRLPQAPGDVERFTHELRIGKEAGATIFRTATGGRRYEIFTQRSDFEQWKAGVRRSLELAEPIAQRLGVRIAVENHKDFETAELLELMKAISSKQIGVCLDTGNSLALLESPLEVVRQLAPYTLTVHFKDIAVHLTEDGFEMAEVPLGQGMFDLPEMIHLIQAEAPKAEFHLEMMTRDPLSIPCLRESYWASFPNKPGTDLARTLTLVKARGLPALTHVSTLPPEACLVLEEKNIIDSIIAAGDKLGFSQMDLKALLKEE
jgi:3-oxoisoapionate decarboxylase